MQVNSFQENLDRQIFNAIKSIFVSSKGKIISFLDENEGICEVKLKDKILINNQITYNNIICKIIDCNGTTTYNVDDEVVVLFTDYNQSTNASIDIKTQRKHTSQNGLIVARCDDFNKDNNKDVIIQSRKEENIIITSENNIAVEMKKKMIVKNQDANLYQELNVVQQNFNQFKTSMNTLLTTDLTTGTATTAQGPAPVVFSTLSATATQITTQLTNIYQSLTNILKLFTNENS